MLGTRSEQHAVIQNYGVHYFRHISATELVNNGTPMTVVNAIANWKLIC